MLLVVSFYNISVTQLFHCVFNDQFSLVMKDTFEFGFKFVLLKALCSHQSYYEFMLLDFGEVSKFDLFRFVMASGSGYSCV